MRRGARLQIHTLTTVHCNWGVFECDIAHCQSVEVFFMLYKMMCNPKRPVYGVLPGPYVPVRVTRGAFVARWYTYAPPRCRTSQ